MQSWKSSIYRLFFVAILDGSEDSSMSLFVIEFSEAALTSRPDVKALGPAPERTIDRMSASRERRSKTVRNSSHILSHLWLAVDDAAEDWGHSRFMKCIQRLFPTNFDVRHVFDRESDIVVIKCVVGHNTQTIALPTQHQLVREDLGVLRSNPINSCRINKGMTVAYLLNWGTTMQSRHWSCLMFHLLFEAELTPEAVIAESQDGTWDWDARGREVDRRCRCRGWPT